LRVALGLLGIELSEEEKITVLQLSTQSVEAARYNYEGIDAIDNEQLEQALDLFRKATKADPYYRDAQQNYARYFRQVSGHGILTSALSQLDEKRKARAVIDALFDSLMNGGHVIEVGDPETKTYMDNPDYIDLTVPMKLSLNEGMFDKTRTTIISFAILAKGGLSKYRAGQEWCFDIETSHDTMKYFWDVLIRQTLIVHLLDKNNHVIAERIAYTGEMHDEEQKISFPLHPFGFRRVILRQEEDLNTIEFKKLKLQEAKEITGATATMELLQR